MQARRQSDGQVITLSSELDRGGEGRVLLADGMPGFLAKLYESPNEVPLRKLAIMLKNPPEDPRPGGVVSIAWPVDLLRADGGEGSVVGFLMERVEGAKHLSHAFIPQDRLQWCPWFEYRYLHRTARNLATAVQALHDRGYVVGDVSYSNVLVKDNALVALVDTDSFQVRDPESGAVYRCPVGKEEYTPPELQGQAFAEVDRRPEHDLFGLAVLIFQLLMEGMHPFNGRFTGAEEDPCPALADRIKLGWFPYRPGLGLPYEPALSSLKFDVLHPALRNLFLRCFEGGHTNPEIRPDGKTWAQALDGAEKDLRPCAANGHHWYGRHLRSCPWCERVIRLRGQDAFPSSVQAVQKQRSNQAARARRTRQAPPAPLPSPALGAVPTGPSGLVPQPGPMTPAPVHSPAYHLDVGSLQQLVRTIGIVWAIGVAGLFAFALHSAGAPSGQWPQPAAPVTGARDLGAAGDSGTAALREVGATLSAYLSDLASQTPPGTSQAAGTSAPPSVDPTSTHILLPPHAVTPSDRRVPNALRCPASHPGDRRCPEDTPPQHPLPRHF